MASDVACITTLIVSRLGIKDLTGIEHFVSLEQLDCKRNQLTKLDISKNTMLKALDCSWNQLQTLDVSNNASLAMLLCDNNQLSYLNTIFNTELLELECYNNSFTDDSAVTVHEVTLPSNFGTHYGGWK